MAEKKEKKYVIDNVQLMAEWDWKKNNECGFFPDKLTCFSHKKVWWVCKHQHRWQAIIQNRSAGNGCPYCAGQAIVVGVNDLQTLNPKLAKEWDYVLNQDLLPSEVMPNSNRHVWWKCEKGHSWRAAIAKRNNGNGCPYCAGQLAISGVNDLQTINPCLAEEWDYILNSNIMPSDILPNSNINVWWKCSQGHSWKARVADRNRGKGCPYCSNQRVLKGYNDLSTMNPALAQEWNYELNGTIFPTDVTANSGKNVWWRCSKGHEWKATIYHRNNGISCPFCSGQLPIKGVNDLQTLNPKLAKEWDYNLNNGLTPFDVMPNSGQKVWWRCNKGHSWKATIQSRSRGNGCPICSSSYRTSFPEYALVYYFTKCGLDVIQTYNELGYELDIYIPSLKVAIEYDGGYWHKNNIKKDLAKNQKCMDDGIRLYRIRENIPILDDSSIDFVVQNVQIELPNLIQDLAYNLTGTNLDVDFERDYIEIEALREHVELQHSLLNLNPKLASEWNYEKNGSLLPHHITLNSSKKVWWVCSKGHEWKSTVANRTNGRGCPYCSSWKKRVINLDTNEIFDSCSEAARKYNIAVTNISCCCSGSRKTAGGYRWKYYTEEEKQSV